MLLGFGFLYNIMFYFLFSLSKAENNRLNKLVGQNVLILILCFSSKQGRSGPQTNKLIWSTLTICCYHVTYAFQSESTLYICVNVKEEISGCWFESCWCHLNHQIYLKHQSKVMEIYQKVFILIDKFSIIFFFFIIIIILYFTSIQISYLQIYNQYCEFNSCTN